MIALAKAREIAREIVIELSPFCERIEVAGSIRREKPQVKDIEIVAVPRLEPTQAGLFGEPGEPVNLLRRKLDALVLEGILKRRKDPSGTECWGERHQRALYGDGANKVPVDLFGVLPPAEWGVIFAIRTGSAEFSRRMVTRRIYGGMMPEYTRVVDGALWRVDPHRRDEKIELVPTPEEGDFFRAIGYPDYPDPQERLL